MLKNKPKKEISVVDDNFDVLLKLEPTSEIALKPKTGTLKCLLVASNEYKTIKFKKTSKIYNLLSGYLLIKDLYRKPRLIAVEMDDKLNVDVLEGKKLKLAEKKFKKYTKDWTIIHKNSLGIGV